MVMTGPVADLLTRIRNVNMAKHETLEVPASKVKRGIVEILKRGGLIHDIECIEDDKQGVTHVFLRHDKDEEHAIINLKRISKPGLHAYVETDEVPRVLNGLGVAVVSTSESVTIDREVRARNINSEVVAYVW